MVERPADRIETVFEEYGALPKPRLVGRLVRLGLGVWLLSVLYMLITDGWQISSHISVDFEGLVDTTPPTHWMTWAFIGFAFWLTPYVINIGASVLRRAPRLLVRALSADRNAGMRDAIDPSPLDLDYRTRDQGALLPRHPRRGRSLGGRCLVDR